MAGIRRRNGKNGKPRHSYEGWYRNWQGRRTYFTGTSNKKETLAMASNFEEQHRKIRLGYAPRPSLPEDDLSFRSVVEEYLAWGSTQGGRSGDPWGKGHARMRTAYLDFWEESLGLEKLNNLVGVLPRVEKVLRELHKTGKTGKTLTNYADGLTAFCDWCVKRGYLESDPLRLLGTFDKTPRSLRRPLTPSELRALLDGCAEERRLLYELAICTGLRAGELAALRTRHFDRDRGGLRLEGAWTKNRKPGFQPLPGWLTQKLSGYLAGRSLDDAVVCVPSHPARELDKDLRTAGIQKTTPEGKIDFHAFRSVYVTLVIEAGATVKEAQSLARHSTPELTMNVYARVRDKRLSDVVEMVGKSVQTEKTFDLCVAQPDLPPRRGRHKSSNIKNLIDAKEWWRRRESNPRPEVRPCVLLHA